MVASFQKPKDDLELQQREAAGLWKAQALAKRIAESDQKITLEVILKIHRVFQEEANPPMAGRFRVPGEDIKKLACMTPPPGSAVQEEIYIFWREFDRRISLIPEKPKGLMASKTSIKKRTDQIIDLAAWTQYQLARIHPFCEGNGRMARLMTNVVLQRFNFLPSDIKYEGENKQNYLHALCEIDKNSDYRMLVKLIIKGSSDSYKKLIELKKLKNSK